MQNVDRQIVAQRPRQRPQVVGFGIAERLHLQLLALGFGPLHQLDHFGVGRAQRRDPLGAHPGGLLFDLRRLPHRVPADLRHLLFLVGLDERLELLGLLRHLVPALPDQAQFRIQLRQFLRRVLLLLVGQILLLRQAGLLDRIQDLFRHVHVPDQRRVDRDPLFLQRPGQGFRQLVLELLPALAHDEILRAVRRPLQARHRQDLRHDHLVHRRRQIPIRPEQPRNVLRQQLEFHRHVQADLEAVPRRKLHELIQHERQRRRGLRRRGRRQLFRSLGIRIPSARFAPDRRRGRQQPPEAHAGAGFGLHVAFALRLLLLQDVLLQPLHGHVVRGLQRLGDHRPAALAHQRHLVHADLQHVHLVFPRIHEIQPRLQHVAAHALLARPGKGVLRRLTARQRGHHAVIADRDADGVHDVNLVAHRIHPVLARPEHVPPDAFLAALRQEFPFRQFLADLRGHHAHLARGNHRHRPDVPLVEPRVQKMPALAQHILPDAPLALLGQDLPRRQVLAGLRRDHRHLVRPHVEPAESPQPHDPHARDHRRQHQRHLDSGFHCAPPFAAAGT